MEKPSPFPRRAIHVAGSKSVCNRALLLSALASGTSELTGTLEADDTLRMRECLRGLGIAVDEMEGRWRVHGGGKPSANHPLLVGASGTTLRFLLPWLALSAEEPIRFQGDPRLFERPLGGLLQALDAVGASWEPVTAGGILQPSPLPPRRLALTVDSSASSQFLSGLAMAAAALPSGGELRWAAPPPSFSYLGLTAHWLAAFDCRSQLTPSGWVIPGRFLCPQRLRLPGDWSGAAAFLCAAAVSGREVSVSPLDPADPQGDRAILAILQAAGCTVTWRDAATVAVRGPLQRGLEANLEQCPDLGPVLAATAALAPGPSRLTGLQTLPLKECDRLDASAELVRWLGGTARILGDHTLEVVPGDCPPPDRLPFDPRNDHRMAFAAAVGTLRCGGQILNPGCVAKTMPTFWEDWKTVTEPAP